MDRYIITYLFWLIVLLVLVLYVAKCKPLRRYKQDVYSQHLHCNRCGKRLFSPCFTVKCDAIFYTDTWHLCGYCYDKVEELLSEKEN